MFPLKSPFLSLSFRLTSDFNVIARFCLILSKALTNTAVKTTKKAAGTTISIASGNVWVFSWNLPHFSSRSRAGDSVPSKRKIAEIQCIRMAKKKTLPET